ncbi:hypothetical protein BO71DRAFT_408099 [Aspergillus ellipticus CBS 707.79]|uniref:Uncharacterized protein n=1 Tax=Aspergillus ellipticus CBS 707.79 TaxID=1448320 RepID=A0A319DF16_9EURO|nr:hypothetical protein BO71DRAFT_408099 [Aspergillus ellipticus CBS 707.79]
MDYPCVKLFSGENLSFSWTSSFKEVRDPDLEAFLHQCCTAISSIKTELKQRRKQPRRSRPKIFEEHRERLGTCAAGIETSQELNDEQAKQAKIAVEIITTSQTTRFEKTYQDILNDISRLCGPELVLLCAAALGKHKISHLNKRDRLHLLDHLKKKESELKVSRLAALVDVYKIPKSLFKVSIINSLLSGVFYIYK